jgi:hypothetical protein
LAGSSALEGQVRDQAELTGVLNTLYQRHLAKTTKIGKLPIKFQFGGQYSVVHEEDYGQRWQIKLNIIPVIPALFKKPLFD